MSAEIIYGRDAAKKYSERLLTGVAELKKQGGELTLCAIQVGGSEDATHYSEQIQKNAEKFGVKYVLRVLSERSTQAQLSEEIRKINADDKITGAMIFSPLPSGLDAQALLDELRPDKDVEGRKARLSVPGTMAELVAPPTALAAFALIQETGTEITGKEAVILGRSDVVGRPLAMMLLKNDATVTICHSRTKHLEAHVKRADILVAAVGRPLMVKGDWIKPGAVVIDVGDNTVDGKVVGDVEFEKAKDKAAFINPVPGGVGPLTNIMLLQNLVNLARQRKAISGDR